MVGEWSTVNIEEVALKIAMGPFGSDIKTDNFVPAGVPVIRGGNLTSGRFHGAEFVFLTEEKADQLANANAFPGDLVFTHRGTLGQVGLIPAKPFTRYVVSQSQMLLRCNPRAADPRFIYYFFKSESGQHALLMNTSQTGVPAISRPTTSLKSIRLSLPPLPEQRAIAHILGTLDDKIELNRRMNETLEAMAQAIFKSWFVDFDPVRAKVERRDTGLPKEIADLFPDSFEESEMGEIPRGWEAQRFADTVDIIGGGTPKTSGAEYWDGDIPWFSVVDAPSNSDVWVVDTAKKITRKGVENSSTRILPVGTTIISARGTVGRIALVAVPMAMNQSCYGLRGKTETHGFFTYFATRELVARLQQHAHGSVFDTITRDTLASVSLASPSIALIEAFEARVGPILERIRMGLLGSRSLAALRDVLLPKLISGELRIATTNAYRTEGYKIHA